MEDFNVTGTGPYTYAPVIKQAIDFKERPCHACGRKTGGRWTAHAPDCSYKREFQESFGRDFPNANPKWGD